MERRSLTEQAWMRGTAWWPQSSYTGRTVTSSNAINHVAVYACVRIIAETIATLPLVTYRRMHPRGRERATEHALYRTLHDEPNADMSSVDFWEAVVGHMCLRGNGFAMIEPSANGRRVQIWPMRPDLIRVDRDPSGSLRYVYTQAGVPTRLSTTDLLHFRGLSYDGVVGYSPVTLAREAIGLAMAAEEFGARLFGNASQPRGLLQSDGGLRPEQISQLKKEWEVYHQGLENAHRVAVLPSGLKWQQIGLAPEDSQFLETRRFQIQEIARMYRVPPHMLGDLERSTFSNIEHQGIEFVTHTLRPWLVRIEKALNNKFFTDSDYYCEFLVDALLRGDLKTRYEAYAVGRNWGWLSANDIAERENLNPIADGDIYLQPLNMVPAGTQPDAMSESHARRVLMLDVGEERSEAGRRRIQRQYRQLLLDASQRVVVREVNDVRRAARRFLERRNAAEFRDWLTTYYAALPTSMAKTWTTVLSTYAEAISESAADEIDGEPLPDDDRSATVASYVENGTASYARRQLAQLEQILRDSDPALALPAIELRLDDWRETKARKVADYESVAAAAAFAISTWRRGGVRRLIWRARGENCPWCTRLNGKVVGIEREFVGENEEIEGGQGKPKFKSKRRVKHAPLHRSCDCSVRPG